MRVMIIAGEDSGDLHGAGVVAELLKLDPAIEIFGIGGDRMQSKGMKLVFHARELAVMGFWEVLQHLPLLRSVEKTMMALLKARRPDVVLLIDYPGFNLRFAKAARRAGIRVVYYISPQVWAWNPGRVRGMRGVVDLMLVVFPFEVDIYRQAGIPVEFVGHPLLDVLGQTQERLAFLRRYGLRSDIPLLGLFPGSRRQEIERIFPAMLGAVRLLQQDMDVQVCVGVSPALDRSYLESFVRKDLHITFLMLATYDLMANADGALVTSGTATLEAGYHGTPMIVVYKTSPLSYFLGRILVRIRMIGLVNIVAGEKVVPELIQGAATPERMAEGVKPYLTDGALRNEARNRLALIRERLGTSGAARRVAGHVLGRV